MPDRAPTSQQYVGPDIERLNTEVSRYSITLMTVPVCCCLASQRLALYTGSIHGTAKPVQVHPAFSSVGRGFLLRPETRASEPRTLHPRKVLCRYCDGDWMGSLRDCQYSYDNDRAHTNVQLYTLSDRTTARPCLSQVQYALLIKPVPRNHVGTVCGQRLK